MLFFIWCLCMQKPLLQAATYTVCEGRESMVMQVHLLCCFSLFQTGSDFREQMANQGGPRIKRGKKPNSYLPHPKNPSFSNLFTILLQKTGKIQLLVREQRNQNQNKTLAAPFQLHLSWVMKETLSSQGKKKQLQDLRMKCFNVARSLQYSSSNSAFDL